MDECLRIVSRLLNIKGTVYDITNLDSPLEPRLSCDLRRGSGAEMRGRGERELRGRGDISRSLFKLKSSNLSSHCYQIK